MLKVLSVYNRYLNRGGEDEVFEDEALLLRLHGVRVNVVTEQVVVPMGLLSKFRLAQNAIWSKKWKNRFIELLQTLRPDVVHVHNFFPGFSPAIFWACHRVGLPVIYTLHNYRLLCPGKTFFRDGAVCEDCAEHSLWRAVKHSCYRSSRAATAASAIMLSTHRRLRTWVTKVDCYVALTEFARQKFSEKGLPAEKIVVKPNFVNPDPGVRTGKGKYALFVGRLAPEKGIRTLVAAWRRFANRIPLHVIGDGPLQSELDEEKRKGGLSTLILRGRLRRDQTLEAMKGARFLVFPSKWYEGFPLTIVEAFACGVPVIASRLGAMEELVVDWRTGLHFTAGDGEDLARRLEWSWNHEQEMQEMGFAARAEYEAKYTAERNYQMLMEIYERAIRSRR